MAEEVINPRIVVEGEEEATMSNQAIIIHNFPVGIEVWFYQEDLQARQKTKGNLWIA